MHLWHDLDAGPDIPNVIHAVIEIPRGSRNKYELHKPTGGLKLDRVLYSAVHYPGDYGLIPQTYYDDGDPLDVMVLTNNPTFPGCIVEVRPIGVFQMRDGGEQDDKILAVPHADPFFADYHNFTDIPSHFIREMTHFFEVYKQLEGKVIEPLPWEDAESAKKRILHAVQLYQEKFGKK